MTYLQLTEERMNQFCKEANALRLAEAVINVTWEKERKIKEQRSLQIRMHKLPKDSDAFKSASEDLMKRNEVLDKVKMAYDYICAEYLRRHQAQ